MWTSIKSLAPAFLLQCVMGQPRGRPFIVGLGGVRRDLDVTVNFSAVLCLAQPATATRQ